MSLIFPAAERKWMNEILAGFHNQLSLAPTPSPNPDFSFFPFRFYPFCVCFPFEPEQNAKVQVANWLYPGGKSCAVAIQTMIGTEDKTPQTWAFASWMSGWRRHHVLLFWLLWSKIWPPRKRNCENICESGAMAGVI